MKSAHAMSLCGIRLLLLLTIGGCVSHPPSNPNTKSGDAPPVSPPVQTPLIIKIPPPKIALVLGGGAAKGFAHIGVIKALESQGVQIDIVVGTSAGSLVGALYAAGNDGFALQRLALDMNESFLSDWSLPDRGFLKGAGLQDFVNKTVQNRTIEKLNKPLAIVATDLQSGEAIAFQRGDTGMAVRASSTIPGIYQPVHIGERDYVDGGLSSPIPVRTARRMGADIVIASDISAKPGLRHVQDTIDILLQAFTIMGNAIAAQELLDADVVVKPNIKQLNATDFQSRHLAILEGEQAGLAAMSQLKQKLVEREARLRSALSAAPVGTAVQTSPALSK